MKWIIFTLLLIVLHLFLPWYVLVVTAYIFGWSEYNQPMSKVFSFALGCSFLVWIAAASSTNYFNDFLIGGRVAEMFILSSSFYIVLLTGIIGGLVGGLSALTGYYTSLVIKKK